MRYSVISFPLRFRKPVSSDFRLLAYAIAWFRKIVCSEVYIIDTDTGDCVEHYRSTGMLQRIRIRGPQVTAEPVRRNVWG